MSRRRLRLLSLASLLGPVAVLVALEASARLFPAWWEIDAARLAAYREYVSTGRGIFDSHPYSLYVPRGRPGRPDVPGTFDPTVPEARVAGVPRIACLGGSTTARGYPERLGEILAERIGGAVEVQNWGSHGWTSAESLVNWVVHAQDDRPDVVVVHHAVNDVHARTTPSFRRDYSHYRRAWRPREPHAVRAWLVRVSDAFASWSLSRNRYAVEEFVNVHERGSHEPLPLTAETASPFRRNIETIGVVAEERGARVVLMTMPHFPAGDLMQAAPEWLQIRFEGIREHNEVLRALASEHGWLLADLAAWVDERPEESTAWIQDDVHWRESAIPVKAAFLADFLTDAGVL